MTVKKYQDLVVWQKGMELAKLCYLLTGTFPREELYGLTSQIRKAAASIPANVAEGNARAHTKEYLNHLSIARGSLAEVETFLILSCEVGFLQRDALEEILPLCDEIGRMLAGLRTSLSRRT